MQKEKRRPGYIPPIDPELLKGIKRIEKNIAYASQSHSQAMDLYYPPEDSEKIHPVIVYYHGGGFELGDKEDEDLEPMLRCLERGYVLASVNYRKSGEARFPAQLYDAKAAIRFLRANADLYRLDPSHIGVWGPSSGGWIVGMLGTTADNPAFENRTMGNGKYSSSVQAAVDWCGPTADFLEMDKMALAAGREIRRPHSGPDSPESRFMGRCIAEIPELCRMAAPINYVSAASAPFLIVHGTADTAVPVEQSIHFHEALVSAIGPEKARIYLAEGMPHHGNVWYTERWVSDMCMDFFVSKLKKEKI